MSKMHLTVTLVVLLVMGLVGVALRARGDGGGVVGLVAADAALVLRRGPGFDACLLRGMAL